MRKKFFSIFFCLISVIMISIFTIDASAAAMNFGDADNDDNVNIKDATLVQMHVSKSATITGDTTIVNADADGDGVITIRDATTIQQYCSRMIDYMPADKANYVEKTTDVGGYYKQVYRP